MRIKALLSVCLCLSVLFGAGLPSPLDAAPFAYIPNSGGNTVSIIDTANNGVVKTVAVGRSPYGVALLVKESETFSFITNYGSNSVSVIRTSNDAFSNPVFEKVRDITVGRFPYGIAVDPAGTFVYVANFGDGTVSKIDLGTYETVAVIPVGSNPMGIVVSPNGAKVYVLNNSSGTVSIVNASDNTVAGTVRVGSNPYGIAIHPQGTFLYVANAGDNSISVIKTADNSFITRSDIHFSTPWGVAVNPAGTLAYITNFNSDSISLFDTGANAVSSPNIPVETNPIGVSLSSDGLFTYVVNSGQGTVSVISNTTNTIIKKITVGDRPYALGSFIAPMGKTVPTVTATTPMKGAEDVAVNIIVEATFSDMMDASSINSSTFLMSDGVTGTIAYNSVTKTASFKPDKPLSLKTYYTATLTTGIKNTTGNPLASNYNWTFKTSESDGSCFIATAVYGSHDHVNVRILRNFRDQHLLSNIWGAVLVDLYYHCSPSIADLIREHPLLRTAARWILAPVVFFALYPAPLAGIFALALIVVFGTKKWKFLKMSLSRRR